MKIISTILFLFAITLSTTAQEKVVQHDGDPGKWINTLEKGYIITSGRAAELEQAKQQAIENVRLYIVQSVAERVEVTTSHSTTELSGDVTSFLDTWKEDVATQSGNVPFLKGISLSKIDGWYWEKIKDKSTKAIFYRYHILYPFSERELNSLIAAYEKNDRELTERLNHEIDIIDHTTSLDEMVAAQNRLREMSILFKDQRKQKVRAGLAAFKATMQTLSVVPVVNHPGKMTVQLKSGERMLTVAKNPRLSSPCAEIIDVTNIEGKTQVTYNYDYCRAGSDQNILEFYYVLGAIRLKDEVRFDITAYQVELSMGGTIQLKFINNLAKLSIPVKTEYNTAFTVTRIELELGDDLQLIFDQTVLPFTGKGVHHIQVEKALSSEVLKELENYHSKKVSGRIFYTQDDTRISDSYRIYKAGFNKE